MKFLQVADIFEQIEKESSRVHITKLLAQLLDKVSPQEARIISYLASGVLFPPYQTLQFNISQKGMILVVAKVLDQEADHIEKEFKKHGDFGLLIEQQWQYKDTGLTIQQVYDALVACAQISGTGSAEKKQKALVHLLQHVASVCAKYIIRIVLGTLRLGFSDMTIIDALSWMQAGDKSLRKIIEHAYNICADLGLVAYTLKDLGLAGIEHMQIHIGIPIRPAAAERLDSAQEIIEKLGPCIVQPKLDGFRVQIHIKKTKHATQIEFFSRNLLDMSAMFPELKAAAKKLNVETLICEGEAITFDQDLEQFLPFQETVKRKRKHDVEKASEALPLRLYLFDILYFNGQSLLDKPYAQRRKLLETLIKKDADASIQLVDEIVAESAHELQTYFLKNIHAGLEGIVAKRADALYQPGKRNFNWIKLKRHARGKLMDTIDVVILGYYAGKGKRAKFGVGAFLVGVYNVKKDVFQTVAKIGTGLGDAQWIDLKKRCDQIHTEKKPVNVQVPKELYPDVWVDPALVCVVQSDEITLSPLHTAAKTEEHAGYALRFPRFISYRLDKGAFDATTTQELEHLYKEQKVDKNK